MSELNANNVDPDQTPRSVASDLWLHCLPMSLITKTCLFKYIENFTSKNWKFLDKKTLIFFHISAQNIDCGYSLEPPQRGSSNEYPQSMFWAEIWKYLSFLSENVQFLEVKFSIYLNRRVFVMFQIYYTRLINQNRVQKAVFTIFLCVFGQGLLFQQESDDYVKTARIDFVFLLSIGRAIRKWVFSWQQTRKRPDHHVMSWTLYMYTKDGSPNIDPNENVRLCMMHLSSVIEDTFCFTQSKWCETILVPDCSMPITNWQETTEMK